MSFYVYKDWTLEETPRCFYVGKGNLARVEDLRRNQVHERIVRKHGIRREIVITTMIEADALQFEVELISHHKTYVNGGDGWWGANLTLGGEGVSGLKHTAEARQKMSLAKRGKPSTFTGANHSAESRKLMSEKAKGRKLSPKTRQKVSLAMTGERNPRSKLSNEDRKLAVDMFEAGMNRSEIADQLKTTYALINGLIQRQQRICHRSMVSPTRV